MEKILGPNWKTTVAGVAGAVLQILIPTVQQGGAIHTEQWISAAAIAVLGILAGDSAKLTGAGGGK